MLRQHSLLQLVLPCVGLLINAQASDPALPAPTTPSNLSVSALNYEETPQAEWYSDTHSAPTTNPTAVPLQVPDKPQFYVLVPGTAIASNVPWERVHRELAIALARRGYFDIVEQIKAGHKPNHYDLVIRVDYGVRFWTNPVVRFETVTWGNAGFVSIAPDSRSVIKHWSNPNNIDDHFVDDRSGQDPFAQSSANSFLHTMGTPLNPGGRGSGSSSQLSNPAANGVNATTGLAGMQADKFGETRDFALILVQAFKFNDVRDHHDNARCIWGTFVAVPREPKQSFATLFQTMFEAATPYFGKTTQGLQVYDQDHAHVIVGDPVMVK